MINVHGKGNKNKITQDIKTTLACVIPPYNPLDQLSMLVQATDLLFLPIILQAYLPLIHSTILHSQNSWFLNALFPLSISLSWTDALVVDCFTPLNFRPYHHHPILGYKSCPWPPGPHIARFCGSIRRNQTESRSPNY